MTIFFSTIEEAGSLSELPFQSTTNFANTIGSFGSHSIVLVPVTVLLFLCYVYFFVCTSTGILEVPGTELENDSNINHLLIGRIFSQASPMVMHSLQKLFSYCA